MGSKKNYEELIKMIMIAETEGDQKISKYVINVIGAAYQQRQITRTQMNMLLGALDFKMEDKSA